MTCQSTPYDDVSRQEEEDRLATVNTILVPEGIDWLKLNGYVMEKFNLEIAGGLGPSAGEVWCNPPPPRPRAPAPCPQPLRIATQTHSQAKAPFFFLLERPLYFQIMADSLPVYIVGGQVQPSDSRRVPHT